MNKTIVVTGGEGFIGSAIIATLNELGYDNIVVSGHMSDEKWRNLVGLKFRDYIQADKLAAWLENTERTVSTIFHMGACSSTIGNNTEYIHRNNFEYTRNLAVTAVRHYIQFIYASSAATYGTASDFIDYVPGLHKLRPNNAYGFSKYLFDLYCRENGLFYKNVIGLKFFNIFGPNEYHKGRMRSVVCKAFEEITETGYLTLFDPESADKQFWNPSRDFLYVLDAAKAAIHLALNATTVYGPGMGGIINVGSGHATTWERLAKYIFKAMRKPEQIKYVEMPEVMRGHYQHYTCADTEKIEASGWRPDFTTEEAVQNYICEYLARGNRYLGEDLG